MTAVTYAAQESWFFPGLQTSFYKILLSGNKHWNNFLQHVCLIKSAFPSENSPGKMTGFIC